MSSCQLIEVGELTLSARLQDVLRPHCFPGPQTFSLSGPLTNTEYCQFYNVVVYTYRSRQEASQQYPQP